MLSCDLIVVLCFRVCFPLCFHHCLTSSSTWSPRPSPLLYTSSRALPSVKRPSSMTCRRRFKTCDALQHEPRRLPRSRTVGRVGPWSGVRNGVFVGLRRSPSSHDLMEFSKSYRLRLDGFWVVNVGHLCRPPWILWEDFKRIPVSLHVGSIRFVACRISRTPSPRAAQASTSEHWQSTGRAGRGGGREHTSRKQPLGRKTAANPSSPSSKSCKEQRSHAEESQVDTAGKTAPGHALGHEGRWITCQVHLSHT